MLRPRAWVAWLILVALTLGLAGCPRAARPLPEKRTLLGFFVEPMGEPAGSAPSLRRNHGLLDEVAFFWYMVDSKEDISLGTTPDTTALAFARKQGLKTLAVIHNLGPGGFDPRLAHEVLSKRPVRENLIRNIERLLEKGDFDGVLLDIERVPPGNRDDLVTFLQGLSARLRPSGKIIEIAVPAKIADDPTNDWSGGFDYNRVGQVVDKVILMTYDENGLGTTAGPIASLPWVRNVLRYASSQIPRHKILMGIPVYAFDWSSENPTFPTYMTHDQAVKLARTVGAKVKWDGRARVPFFTYTKDGTAHRVYFENRSSVAAKLNLVNEFDLRGAAIWRLGMEDQGIWEAVKSKLNK